MGISVFLPSSVRPHIVIRPAKFPGFEVVDLAAIVAVFVYVFRTLAREGAIWPTVVEVDMI